jgi:predicted DNA-binding WGR domain protein
MSSTSTRIFEYKDDKSAKFWTISQAATIVTVIYGKIGTNGQTKEKVFPDTSTAMSHVEKLISEKVNKGYMEVVNSNSSSELVIKGKK